MVRTLIGTNDWLFIQPSGSSDVIAIKCLTSHSITGSQDINNTVTKCGRKKTPNGAPDFQITGEGEIQLTSSPDEGTLYSYGDLFNLLKNQTQVHVVSAPKPGTEAAGDEVYEGDGFLSALEKVSPADGAGTFTFTFEMEDIIKTKQSS